MIHTLGIGGLGLRRVTGGGIVSAALKMNGADGSATFTDETGKTWTTNGNAQIDTAQSQFGGASGLFDGTGDYITTPDHSDFDFGSGNWTIELWARPASIASSVGVVVKRATGGAVYSPFYVAIEGTTGKPWLLCSANGSSWGINLKAGSGISAGAWTHLAFVRNGDTFQVFRGGTADGTATLSGALMTNASLVTIGAQASDGTTAYNGHLDDVRITKGIAKYTGNFTPPTVEQSYP